jgi:Uma2 family endonuclease
MTAIEKTKSTPADYFIKCSASEEKYEFCNGEIFLMTGGTGYHNIISGNIIVQLSTRLRRIKYRAFKSEMEIHVAVFDL